MHKLARSRQLSLILLYLVLASCQRSENRFLDREISPPEISGVFKMEPGTLEDLRAVGHPGAIDPAAHLLLFEENGICRFRSFELPIEGNPAPGQLLDSACRWSLGKSRHQTLEIALEEGRGRRLSYYFDETGDGRLVLWQYLSDPDAWRYIEYVKQ